MPTGCGRRKAVECPLPALSRTYLMNRNDRNGTNSSGAKAQFLHGPNVGAETPTPVASIYETASHRFRCAPVHLALALTISFRSWKRLEYPPRSSQHHGKVNHGTNAVTRNNSTGPNSGFGTRLGVWKTSVLKNPDSRIVYGQSWVRAVSQQASEQKSAIQR